MTTWLHANLVPKTLPEAEPEIRVVVTRARGLQLALVVSPDDAEAAAHALLKAVSDARAGGPPKDNRMLFYDFELVGDVAHVWETRADTAAQGKRMLFANAPLTLGELAKWTRAWSDEKARTFTVVRLSGGAQSGEVASEG